MLSLAISEQWTVTFIMLMAGYRLRRRHEWSLDRDPSASLQHECWEDDPTGVCVDDRVIVVRARYIGELIPHGTHRFEKARESAAADGAAGPAQVDAPRGPFPSAASAARRHDGAIRHLEQVLQRQAARFVPELLRDQPLRARHSRQQVRPLHDDDTFPYLWRHRRGEMMALADRQITEPALGITSLADVQQPGTGDVHPVDNMTSNACRIRSRRAGQELTDLMRKPVAAILPRQDALWTDERVEQGRTPAAERLVGGRVHAGQFWCPSKDRLTLF